jgi:hypothetical protein
MNAETAVMPGHELLDKTTVYLALSFQHGQDLGPENLFQFLKLYLGEVMGGPVRSKGPIGDNGMKMGMKPCVM